MRSEISYELSADHSGIMSAIFSTLVKRLRKGGGVISTRAEFSGFATGRNYNTKVSENNETSIKNIGIDWTAAIPCEWVIRSAGQHQWYSRHTFQRQRRSGVKRPERRELCSADPKRKGSALRACPLWLGSVRAFGGSRWGQPASQLPSRMGPGRGRFWKAIWQRLRTAHHRANHRERARFWIT